MTITTATTLTPDLLAGVNSLNCSTGSDLHVCPGFGTTDACLARRALCEICRGSLAQAAEEADLVTRLQRLAELATGGRVTIEGDRLRKPGRSAQCQPGPPRHPTCEPADSWTSTATLTRILATRAAD